MASVLGAAVTATAGYGPTVPPGQPVPGGFGTVIASKTFGTGGGTLRANAGKTRFVLRINRGALTRRIQLTLTRPRIGNLKNHVPHGTVPTTGIAVLATYPNGRFVPGRFGSSLVRLTILDRRIAKHSMMLVWNQGKRRFVRYPATVTAGHATFLVGRIHEFVIASSS